MKIPNRLLFLLIILALGANACKTSLPGLQPASAELEAVMPAAPAINTPTNTVTAASPTPETIPSSTPEPADTATPEPITVPPAIGPNPEDIPEGYNPLTGLPASDPGLLDLPAILISITNFPPSARPQAGLSFSPMVFEIYIAEGMTRYLATFYGEFPKISNSANLTGNSSGDTTGQDANQGQTTGSEPGADPSFANVQIGPVRSGRLPYVYIRDFFQDSCLVYASATEQIRARLRGCAMVFGDDTTDINSAMLDVTRLQKIAEQNQRENLEFNYSGLLFTDAPPTQGIPASQIDIYYSYLNQGQWQYDDTAGAFLKFDDFADGTGNFTPATDRINGQQLAFSNVVVLYAEHTVLNPYIIDVKMGMGERGKAVIFRDGQKFEAFWSTVADEYEKTTQRRRPMRFEDANGNPFAFKPGQTWVHIVTTQTEVQDQGDGLWKLRFYAPAGSK